MPSTKLITAAIAILLSACGAENKTAEPAQSTAQPPAEASDNNPWPKLEPALPADPALEKKVAELLAKMTLEEKVGQMIQAEIKYATPEDVKKYNLGSILNGGGTYPNNDKFATPNDWLKLAQAYNKASTDTSDGGVGIPVLWGSDAVHGHNNVIGATLFPHNIGLGAARDPELIRRIGEATAREVAVTGIDWTFAPTVAVVQDDRWGRTFESYSELPTIVGDYAGAMVKGIQGEIGSEEFLGGTKLISATKHFIGDGGTQHGMDRGDAQLSEEELARIHAAGYISALQAGVQTVMASFNSWNGVRLHGHKHLLTDVLKERLGFDGFVVGDWNGHRFVKGCTLESCPRAINAGLDMFMVPSDWKPLWENTLAQARGGEIPISRIDDAVTRILRVKMRAGLFERNKPLAGKKGILGSPEHRAIAREAVRKSLVLLKNNRQLLPLDPKQRILVAGSAANDIARQSGGWSISWQGTGNTREDFPGATSIYEGIASAVTSAGGSVELSGDGSFDLEPDVAVVVFGEEPYAEWHGDISILEYQVKTKSDLALLKKLKSQGIPVVSIFLSGRPLWVNKELNASDAFVAAWLPGSEGAGVADVIFTDADGEVQYDFTGKLSFSWPRLVHQTLLNPGDEDYDPLFPYGYGLNYANEYQLAELTEEGGSYAQGPLKDAWMMVWRPRAPWDFTIFDEGREAVVANGNETASADGNIRVSAVDMVNQQDARLIQWSGQRPGGISLRARQPQDMSRYLEADGAVSMKLRIDEKPSAPVFASISCGADCLAKLPLDEQLQKLEPGEWSEMSIALRCFAQRGAEFSRVHSSLGLEAGGKLSLAVAEIKYVPGAADGATIRCEN